MIRVPGGYPREPGQLRTGRSRPRGGSCRVGPGVEDCLDGLGPHDATPALVPP